MKYYHLILSLLILCSCTKEVNSPQTATTPDSWHRSASSLLNNISYTVTESQTYSGLADADFQVTFPAPNAPGVIVSWKMYINHSVFGFVDLINNLSTPNATNCTVNRYMMINFGSRTLAELPLKTVYTSFDQLDGNEETTENVGFTFGDSINSTSNPLNFNGQVTLQVKSLVSYYKANCTNTATLLDRITMTVELTYQKYPRLQ